QGDFGRRSRRLCLLKIALLRREKIARKATLLARRFHRRLMCHLLQLEVAFRIIKTTFRCAGYMQRPWLCIFLCDRIALSACVSPWSYLHLTRRIALHSMKAMICSSLSHHALLRVARRRQRVSAFTHEALKRSNRVAEKSPWCDQGFFSRIALLRTDLV